MAGIGKLAKVLWKGVSYLPKKAHALQQPFTAPAGGKLSIGKKLANAALKTTNYASVAGMIGAAGLMAYEGYKSKETESHKEYEEHTLKASKYLDAVVGSMAGLVLGGPIGALALGAAAYFTPKDLVLGNISVCKHGGKSISVNELRQQKTAETKQAQETQKPEQNTEVNKEENPEVDDDKKAIEKFCNDLENLKVGQSITVPELKAETGALTMQVEEQKVELKPGDKITRTEEGFEITRANAPKDDNISDEDAEAPADSTDVAPTDSIPSRPVAPSDSTQVAPADSTVVTPVVPAAADSTATAPIQPAPAPQETVPVQQTPPSNNLFGGTLNEISIKEYNVVDGDCLWNIAKAELQKANPGATISNGQILVQVKEFIRLNPQIKNPDLIYPEQQLKLCA